MFTFSLHPTIAVIPSNISIGKLHPQHMIRWYAHSVPTSQLFQCCCGETSISWCSADIDFSWQALQGSKLAWSLPNHSSFKERRKAMFWWCHRDSLSYVLASYFMWPVCVEAAFSRSFFKFMNRATTLNGWQKWWVCCEAHGGRNFGSLATAIRSKGCWVLQTSGSWELSLC